MRSVKIVKLLSILQFIVLGQWIFTSSPWRGYYMYILSSLIQLFQSCGHVYPDEQGRRRVDLVFGALLWLSLSWRCLFFFFFFFFFFFLPNLEMPKRQFE